MYVDEALNSNGRPEGNAGDDPAKLQRHGEMANVQTVHALLFGKYPEPGPVALAERRTIDTRGTDGLAGTATGYAFVSHGLLRVC